ncbi:nuclease homologue [Rhizobium sp. RU35A]|uniref:thermonuclease family protein n=1 Tax=Rhizobium sp. RU35A TaxID=1907414 RepID=UPI00095538F8|nr:thermonuclease family protein [Rhizobium sp. RU35A]SIQ56552.1 nuclease homologue [Rhizobium sp. RU35A]
MAKAASSRRRRGGKKKSVIGTRLWIAALVVVAGGIALHDNGPVRNWLNAHLPDPMKTASARHAGSPSVGATGSGARAASPEMARAAPAPQPRPPMPVATVQTAALSGQESLLGKAYSGTFYFCGQSGLDNCVAGGDLFWFKKQAIRLADIRAPQTDGARCDAERQRGFAAKVRLRTLLNQGQFELVDWPNADGDGGGRKWRVVLRNGQSIGQQLIREGLAHGVSEASKSWC